MGIRVKTRLAPTRQGIKLPAMSTVAKLEASIQNLPPEEFFELAEWMTHRHLEILADDGFESPELEAAMLKGLEGPRHPVDEAFFTQVRAAWKLPEQN